MHETIVRHKTAFMVSKCTHYTYTHARGAHIRKRAWREIMLEVKRANARLHAAINDNDLEHANSIGWIKLWKTCFTFFSFRLHYRNPCEERFCRHSIRCVDIHVSCTFSNRFIRTGTEWNALLNRIMIIIIIITALILIIGVYMFKTVFWTFLRRFPTLRGILFVKEQILIKFLSRFGILQVFRKYFVISMSK